MIKKAKSDKLIEEEKSEPALVYNDAALPRQPGTLRLMLKSINLELDAKQYSKSDLVCHFSAAGKEWWSSPQEVLDNVARF